MSRTNFMIAIRFAYAHHLELFSNFYFQIDDEVIKHILICCVCLGDRSDDMNEIIECDGCGITVHEGAFLNCRLEHRILGQAKVLL